MAYNVLRRWLPMWSLKKKNSKFNHRIYKLRAYIKPFKGILTEYLPIHALNNTDLHLQPTSETPCIQHIYYAFISVCNHLTPHIIKPGQHLINQTVTLPKNNLFDRWYFTNKQSFIKFPHVDSLWYTLDKPLPRPLPPSYRYIHLVTVIVPWVYIYRSLKDLLVSLLW